MKKTPGAFFAVPQRDIAIRGVPARSPTFYRDVRMLMGVFTADLAQCQAELSRLAPQLASSAVRVLPGRGLVAIQAFAYRDTDVGPYGEIAVSIAVRPPGSRLPGPVIAARSAISGDFHGVVVTMPVTTDLALWGGLDFFNFPKYLADIDFTESPYGTTCALRERASGTLELELVGKRLRTRPRPSPERAGLHGGPPSVCTFNSYPTIDGRLSRARVRLHVLERGTSYFGTGLSVRFGTGERARRLERLELGRLLMYWDVPLAEAILYLPEAL